MPIGSFDRRRPSVSGPSTDPAGARRDCDIRLTLPARAENVAIVRTVLHAFCTSLELPDQLVDDIRLAVTEACTNVVRHAYQDGDGPIEVLVRPEDGEGVRVVVADRGRGIAPRSSGGGPGLGLPLIAALTDAFEVSHAPGRGSALAMVFRPSRNRFATAQ